jgi:hypothetical protein
VGLIPARRNARLWIPFARVGETLGNSSSCNQFSSRPEAWTPEAPQRGDSIRPPRARLGFAIRCYDKGSTIGYDHTWSWNTPVFVPDGGRLPPEVSAPVTKYAFTAASGLSTLKSLPAGVAVT